MAPVLIDSFIFFNELDLLEIRLETLAPFVQRFILVEATRTFTGKPKPLYYQENIEQFKKFNDKITHIIADLRTDVHPFVNERAQRDAILGGVLPDDAILMLSDVDEIPRPERFEEMVDLVQRHGACVLGQTLYYYFINLINRSIPIWYGTRAAHVRRFSTQRPSAFRVMNTLPLLRHAGWHYSFLGDVQSMQEKLAAWSHHEWNVPPYNTVENLTKARALGIDWDMKRNLRYEWVPVGLDHPQYLLDHLGDRFAYMVGTGQRLEAL